LALRLLDARDTMGTIRVCVAAAAALSIPGCATVDDVDGDGQNPVVTPGLDDDFVAAGREYGVPGDLLEAISFVETRWQMVIGEEEIEGHPAGSGLFALWGDNLTIGAAAANVDEQDAQLDLGANIAAAAARLAGLARDHGISGDDLMAWQPAIGDFAQAADAESRLAYVNNVLAVLASGAAEVMEDGTPIATLAPHAEVTVSNVGGLYDVGTTDYPAGVWRPSPNFNSRNGTAVSLVVIHTCEGNYAGCWGWLRNTAAGASAHYVIKENGGEVTQLVREASRAWHVAASYECSRAGNQQCNKNGVSTNNFSVGIEHAGFASQASFPNGQIEASAKLTCDITRDHNVVRDRNHIVSHGQLQPWNRTDPGPNWPWSHYIDRVRDWCGDGGGGGGGGGTIVVDSNNANNDAAVGRIELAGTWTSSNGTPGYYGTGYWWGATEAISAPATFWFYLPSGGTKTIDAWWTAGSNRTTAATFVGFNAGGSEVGRRTVNQQGSGSQWVTLGTWSFSAGWNKVALSRWAAAGSVVIADAVRVR
jgi:hypothetical protein